MKLPGPDHPITISLNPRRVRVKLGMHIIADSADVLMLKEASYPAVAYFPREDVEMGYLGKTDKSTHCPYKGDASYYTVHLDGTFRENGIWSYEAPFPAMAQIEGRLAFYADQFEIYEVDPDV